MRVVPLALCACLSACAGDRPVADLPVKIGAPYAVRGRTYVPAADPRYEEAATTLGASRFTAFRRVTLPLIAPGIAAGAVLGVRPPRRSAPGIPPTLTVRAARHHGGRLLVTVDEVADRDAAEALRAATLVAEPLTDEGTGDQFLADQIATNWRHADLDERRATICAVAEKLTATPHLMVEDDLRSLAAVGLTDDEVWDVIEIASMYNFTNRMALATGQQPNEQYHYLDRPQPTGE